MSSTNWQFPISGNWNVGAFWSAGVPTSFTDVAITGPGVFTITVNSFAATNALTMNSFGATLSETAGGTLEIGAGLDIESGTVVLQGANRIYNGLLVNGGELAVGSNPDALDGGSSLTMGSGEFLGLANASVDNGLVVNGDATIAAATGTTLHMNASAAWDFKSGSLTFGDGTNDGTVLWDTPNGSTIEPPSSQVDVTVASGTLKAGAGGLDFLLTGVQLTTVDAGAAIDLAGYTTGIGALVGSGTIETSAGASGLILLGANFAGQIVGNISVDVTGSDYLSGANTYTGGTTIQSGAALHIGDGTGGGSIVGSILDKGELAGDTAGPLSIAGAISGTGYFEQDGPGTTTLSQSNSYAGGSIVETGTLAVTKAAALGSGGLTVHYGEFLALQNMTVTNALTLDTDGVNGIGVVALAAATGTTLKLSSSTPWNINDADIAFGDGTNDGTVVWETPAGSTYTSPSFVKVEDATLKAGATSLSTLLSNAAVTLLDNGTIDIAGHSTTIGNIFNNGTITNSVGGSAAILTIDEGSLNGQITGKISLEVAGNFLLTGNSTFSGGAGIMNGAALLLGDGTTDGTITGGITDNGTVVVDDNGVFTVGGAISGLGSFQQLGNGQTVLSFTDSFTGGTTIGGGVLQITKGAVLSNGALTMEGGELLGAPIGSPPPAGVTMTVINPLTMSGNDTFAAATGDTLKMTGVWTFNPDSSGNDTIQFGDGTNDGTVVWYSPHNSVVNGSYDYFVDVHSGTLKAGDANFGLLTSVATENEVDKGAILDVAGFNATVNDLIGSGTVTDSGGTAATINLVNGDFSGLVSGKITLDINQTVTLDGVGKFTLADILNQAELMLGGTAGEKVQFDVFGTNETLALESGVKFTGTVQGFAVGDTIDVLGVNPATAALTYNPANGLLTLSDGTHSIGIKLSGAYTAGSFHIAADSTGGTDITLTSSPGAAPMADSFDFNHAGPATTSAPQHIAEALSETGSEIHVSGSAIETQPHLLMEALDHFLLGHHNPAFSDFAFV